MGLREREIENHRKLLAVVDGSVESNGVLVDFRRKLFYFILDVR